MYYTVVYYTVVYYSVVYYTVVYCTVVYYTVVYYTVVYYTVVYCIEVYYTRSRAVQKFTVLLCKIVRNALYSTVLLFLKSRNISVKKTVHNLNSVSKESNMKKSISEVFQGIRKLRSL